MVALLNGFIRKKKNFFKKLIKNQDKDVFTVNFTKTFNKLYFDMKKKKINL